MLVSLSLLCAVLHTTAAAPAVSPAERMVRAFESRKPVLAKKLSLQVSEIADAPATERAQARLVTAFSSLRLRQFDDAAEALALLESDGPSLGALHHSLLVGTAVARGGCEEAAESASQLESGSIYAAQAWSRVAMCWMRKRNFESAQQAIERLASGADDAGRAASVKLMQARLWEQTRRAKAARNNYRDILVEYPSTVAARTARQRLGQMQLRGAGGPRSQPEEQLAIANSERSRNRLVPAKTLYLAVKAQVSAKPSLKAADRTLYQNAELGLIELVMVDKSYTEALRRLEALQWARDLGVRARARYLKGDLLARKGQVSQALKTWGWLLKRMPDHPFTIEAAVAAAKLAYGARFLHRSQLFAEWIIDKAAESVAVERRSGTQVGDDGVHRAPSKSGSPTDNAHWLLAWIARRTGAPLELVDSHLSQLDGDGAFAEAALYWRARFGIDAKDADTAALRIGMLTHRAPISFYGLMATDLSQTMTDASKVSSVLPDATSMASDHVVDRSTELSGLVVLAEHGLLSEAKALLRMLPLADLSPADRITASWLYNRTDNLHRAAFVARGAVSDTDAEHVDPMVFQLAFPRPFGDLVERNAQKYAIPVELLYAIMREESSFNPEAVSPRKARGLMQMIRPTARRMARSAQVKRFRVRDLFEPPTSVHLGAHYVASLLDMFDGNIVATIAAYQAGEVAVARWLRSRGNMPADEFIEDIPFSSTRRYVKKVLSSYGIYRALYGNSDEGIIGLSMTETIAKAVVTPERQRTAAPGVKTIRGSTKGWLAKRKNPRLKWAKVAARPTAP